MHILCIESVEFVAYLPVVWVSVASGPNTHSRQRMWRLDWPSSVLEWSKESPLFSVDCTLEKDLA